MSNISTVSVVLTRRLQGHLHTTQWRMITSNVNRPRQSHVLDRKSVNATTAANCKNATPKKRVETNLGDLTSERYKTHRIFPPSTPVPNPREKCTAPPQAPRKGSSRRILFPHAKRETVVRRKQRGVKKSIHSLGFIETSNFWRRGPNFLVLRTSAAYRILGIAGIRALSTRGNYCEDVKNWGVADSLIPQSKGFHN